MPTRARLTAAGTLTGGTAFPKVMPANRTLRVLATVVTLATCAAAAPPPDPSDPYAIFDASRKAWGAGAYPRYANYVAVVSFRNGAKSVRRTWDTTEDIRHGYVYSGAFSREEQANPYVPHGIAVSIPFVGEINKQQPTDPIGQVTFAIDQDYGLSPSGRRIVSTTSLSTLDRQSSKLPVIGRTGTVARDYDVSLIDTTVDAQGPEYHLRLTPLRDPDHNRLRELWVDAATWVPQEAIVAGIGNRPPLTKVLWRIEYRQTQGATYIARETALADVDYGKAGKLQDVQVAFEEVDLRSVQLPYRFGFSTSVEQGEP
jgi:hypothetical protein